MKRIEKEIDKLYKEIEKGLSYQESLIEIKAIRNKIVNHFDEGSDKYDRLKGLLLECKYLASDIKNGVY